MNQHFTYIVRACLCLIFIFLAACGSSGNGPDNNPPVSSSSSSSMSAATSSSSSSNSSEVSVPLGTLTQIENFGHNPGDLEMHVYIPEGLTGSPPILVAAHWCTGSARDLYNSGLFDSQADQHGFIVIFPSSIAEGRCFDVSTQAALTRDGGGDATSIVSMVNYAIQHHGADPNRVYATGISSGAMMTNVLLGLYPDVFKAGAAFAGVPFGCFATTGGSTWSVDCATGNVTRSAQEWGDLSRAQNPGYDGPWPRMQLWHGTEDEALNYVNFGESIKQWTNINGLDQTPVHTDNPQPGYTRTRYGNSGPHAIVEAISMDSVTHSLPVDAAEAIRFFGLDVSFSQSCVADPSVPLATSIPQQYWQSPANEGTMQWVSYPVHYYTNQTGDGPGDAPGDLPRQSEAITKGFNIYLPPDYSEDESYPLVIVLHGIGGNEYSWVGAPTPRPKVVLDALIDAGEIQPLVVVFPNACASANFDDCGFHNRPGYYYYDNELINDLIPFLESNYSVTTHRDCRGLAGFSMGGMQTINLGICRNLKHFASFAPLAAAPTSYNASTVAQCLVEQNQQSPYPISFFYNSHGDSDGVSTGSHQAAINGLKESSPYLFDENFVYHTVPGGHDYPQAIIGLYNYLRIAFPK